MAMRVRKEASMIEEIVSANADDVAEDEEGQTPIMPVLSSDVNPIGSGTIHGSHGLLVRIFGNNDRIAVDDLRRISLDRRFPRGYRFPGRVRNVRRGNQPHFIRNAAGGKGGKGGKGGANSGKGNNDISGTQFVQASIRNINFIICPFLSTMVNEGALPVRQSYTRDELQAATELAGLDPDIAQDHSNGNFVNDPDMVQDIFNLEGVSNEHVTSTGIHDCGTEFSRCSGNETPQGERECRARTNRDCRMPSGALFEQFALANDRNDDGFITLGELEEAALAAEAAGEQLCSVLSCPNGCDSSSTTCNSAA